MIKFKNQKRRFSLFLTIFKIWTYLKVLSKKKKKKKKSRALNSKRIIPNGTFKERNFIIIPIIVKR